MAGKGSRSHWEAGDWGRQGASDSRGSSDRRPASASRWGNQSRGSNVARDSQGSPEPDLWANYQPQHRPASPDHPPPGWRPSPKSRPVQAAPRCAAQDWLGEGTDDEGPPGPPPGPPPGQSKKFLEPEDLQDLSAKRSKGS